MKSKKDSEEVIQSLTKRNTDLENENKTINKLYAEVKDRKEANSEEHPTNFHEYYDYDNLPDESYEEEHDVDDNEEVSITKECRNPTTQTNIFKCTNCKFSAIHESLLKQHKSENHRKPCRKCKYIATNEEELKSHEEKSHAGSGAGASKQKVSEVLLCDFCEYTTEIPVELNLHEHNVHKKNGIKCNLCDFTARDEAILKKHHLIAMGHKRKIACRFFIKGICNRGRFCKFEHNRSESQVQEPINNNRQYGFQQRGQSLNFNNNNNSNTENYLFNNPQQQPFTNFHQSNRQCKFRENCHKFPNCGFFHGEVCRYQENCYKQNQCRFVHLPEHFLGVNMSPISKRNI